MRLLVEAEPAALVLALLGGGDVTVAAQLADLPRELVDPGPGLVALGRDLAQPGVEQHGGVDLDEQRRVAPAGQAGADDGGVGAQQADVDHGKVTLPAGHVTGRLGSSAAGMRANSRATWS